MQTGRRLVFIGRRPRAGEEFLRPGHLSQAAGRPMNMLIRFGRPASGAFQQCCRRDPADERSSRRPAEPNRHFRAGTGAGFSGQLLGPVQQAAQLAVLRWSKLIIARDDWRRQWPRAGSGAELVAAVAISPRAARQSSPGGREPTGDDEAATVASAIHHEPGGTSGRRRAPLVTGRLGAPRRGPLRGRLRPL